MRCLQLGELVCETLESLFGGRSRPSREPLTLFLYETREVYLEQSRRGRSAPEAARGWTAGHYSPAENLSRMFVPSDDEDYARLLGVYVHELTHHWLATRAPFPASRSASADRPGYWIAEGFATLVEEFRFDPASSSWSFDNPRAESLDLMDNLRPEDLIPWERFFSLSWSEFGELDAEQSIPVTLNWRLGAHGRVSRVRVFYAQAGAVCRYLLLGEGGRFREGLLRTIERWERGEPDEGIQRTFGISPAELGGRL